LDRTPLFVITDGFNEQQKNSYTHQVFDQQSLVTPLAKAHSKLDGQAVGEEIERLIKLAMTPPWGPVHIELTKSIAQTKHPPTSFHQTTPVSKTVPASLVSARNLLTESEKPVVIVGLEARDQKIAGAIQELIESLGCPGLTTYKAKGVIPDAHPNLVGLFTGGRAETETVQQADLIVLLGLDPVELILQPWPYQSKVLDVSLCRHPVHYLEPELGVYGPLEEAISSLKQDQVTKSWTLDEITSLRQKMYQNLNIKIDSGISPQAIVEIASSKTGGHLPITIDAGAHMFSVMAFWKTDQTQSVFISNGLASMGFALPAAIAVSLEKKEDSVMAFTGDGGLMMCLGELATAVQYHCKIIVVVFNDGSLSLIDIKQQQRGLENRGVRWPRQNFAQVMQGLGGHGWKVETIENYHDALDRAIRCQGPALIDVHIDSSGYPSQLEALR
jgi:acetolactate synthase-1/2/3 large subunit